MDGRARLRYRRGSLHETRELTMADKTDYTDYYGTHMTDEQFEEFKAGLAADLRRIREIGDDEREKVEISKLFARLAGHKFDS